MYTSIIYHIYIYIYTYCMYLQYTRHHLQNGLGISSFSFEMLLASLASGPDGAEALGPHADLGPHARRPGTAQVDFIFFGIFKNTCFFAKNEMYIKNCVGICVGDTNVGFFQEFLVPEVDNAGDFNAAGRLSNRGFKSSHKRNLISVNNKAELHSRMYSTRIFLTYFL